MPLREFTSDRAAAETAARIDLESAILSVVSPHRDRIVAAPTNACLRPTLLLTELAIVAIVLPAIFLVFPLAE